MTRVSAPVDELTLRFVMEHAADLGLPANASQARVTAQIIDLGAKSLARRVRDAERDSLYVEWADDPERLAAAQFHEEAGGGTGAY